MEDPAEDRLVFGRGGGLENPGLWCSSGVGDPRVEKGRRSQQTGSCSYS